jgi:prolipoprotein diacylglyceryl transferase
MVEWNVDREILSIGFITIRYYSMMFLASFLVGLVLVKNFFKAENRPPQDVDDLLVYIMIGTIIGARLGHVIFYGPAFYFSNPVEILKVWKGGLASHGGAVGVMLALYVFVKNRPHYNFLWLVDRVAVVTALAACFIRLGNLFNSEIYGIPTQVPWAFKFSRYVDDVPRHPTQIYEALAYLAIFLILYKIYQSKKEKTPPGYLLGLFLILVFGFRLFVEQFKVVQESFEEGMILNMGQLLSIPLVLAGFYFVISSKNRPLPKLPQLEKSVKKKK